MLDPEQTWIDEFKKLPPAKTPIEGITAQADLIEKLTNKVDPLVPDGQASPGVFQWNKALFVSQMMLLVPTQGAEWVQAVSAAWFAGCSGAVITPGLVNAPSLWPVSMVDANTLPSAAVTVATLSAGKEMVTATLNLMPDIMSSTPDKGPELFAKAFRNGVMAFTFTLIGIAGTPVSPVPLPVVATAQ